jgi:hypothetical protein
MCRSLLARTFARLKSRRSAGFPFDRSDTALKRIIASSPEIGRKMTSGYDVATAASLVIVSLRRMPTIIRVSQLTTEGVFELPQPPTYRGVSNPKLFCRSSETEVVGNDEGPANRYRVNSDRFCDTLGRCFFSRHGDALRRKSQRHADCLHLGSLQLELSLSRPWRFDSKRGNPRHS